MLRIPLLFVLPFLLQLVLGATTTTSGPPPPQEGNGKYIVKVKKQQGLVNAEIDAVKRLLGIESTSVGYDYPFISSFVATLSDAQKASIESDHQDTIEVSVCIFIFTSWSLYRQRL
jgi:hypothetical protein